MITTGFGVGLLFAVFQVHLPKQYRYGYAQLADALARTTDTKVFLVCSSAQGEGAGVAEVAVRDAERPKHFVLRASKLLAQSGWNGENYRLLYSNPKELSDFLEKIPVDYVVLDAKASREEPPHQTVLRSALQSYPAHWGLLASYQVDETTQRPASHISVYKRQKPRTGEGIEFSIDMTRSLIGILQYSSPSRR